MLHDLLQNSGLQPNIWELEPWHIYDIGILPNDIWRNNWVQAAKNYYAHPKYGIFLAGWPKADKYLEKVNNRNYFRNQKNRKFVILYAPSFEIENKQDDIVQACKDLGVKLLIKHYPIEQKKEPELFNNIISVQNKHI